jgi:hypothetical protein
MPFWTTKSRLPQIHLQRTIVLVFARYELRPWLSPGQSLPFGPIEYEALLIVAGMASYTRFGF